MRLVLGVHKVSLVRLVFGVLLVRRARLVRRVRLVFGVLRVRQVLTV